MGLGALLILSLGMRLAAVYTSSGPATRQVKIEPEVSKLPAFHAFYYRQSVEGDFKQPPTAFILTTKQALGKGNSENFLRHFSRLPVQLVCLFPVFVEFFELFLHLGHVFFDLANAVAVAVGFG